MTLPHIRQAHQHIQGNGRKMSARLVARASEFAIPVVDASAAPWSMHRLFPAEQSHGQQSMAFDVVYELWLGEQQMAVSQCVGEQLSLSWSGKIHCVSCGRRTAKSYAQGHCYVCLQKNASCDVCMMQPERCHYHLGTCREPEWAEQVCFHEHVVYLSYTSGVKVGITRASQVPTRWIDQGAVAAVPVFTTSSRRLAGVVEQHFKGLLADKTDWRKMLKGQLPEAVSPTQALIDTRDELISHHLFALEDSISTHEMITANDSYEVHYDLQPIVFHYPVNEYPMKVKSVNFEKTPDVTGTLLGIKGQYLILDTGVLNVRKFSGYELTATLGLNTL